MEQENGIDDEDEEEDFVLRDENEALFEVEEKERTVYCIDASDTMRKDHPKRFRGAVKYIEKIMREMIKEETNPDLIGIIVYGDRGSKRAVRCVSLGKVRGDAILTLKSLLEKEDAIDIIASDENKTFDYHQYPALRNALFYARIQLEKQSKGSRRKKIIQRVILFTCVESTTIDLDSESQREMIFTISRDYRAVGRSIEVVCFGNPALSRNPALSHSFWEGVIENKNSDEGKDQLYFISEDDSILDDKEFTEEKIHLITRRRRKARACASLELTFLFEPENTIRPRLKKMGLFKTSRWPKQVYVHSTTGESLRSVTTKMDDELYVPLRSNEIRKYHTIGTQGRCYSDPDELQQCAQLDQVMPDNLQGDGELLILGFVSADETIHKSEFFLSRGKRTDVLIGDDDEVPASSEALAAIVAAMSKKNQVAVALYATRSLANDKNRSNPCFVLIEPKISTAPPTPSGLLIHCLPFQHERLLLDKIIQRNQSPTISDQLQSASDALVASLRTEENLPFMNNSPSVATKWALVENCVLNDATAIETIKKRTHAMYPKISTSSFLQALDTLAGTQIENDQKDEAAKSKKRKRDETSSSSKPACTSG